jgi:hypothetical protein
MPNFLLLLVMGLKWFSEESKIDGVGMLPSENIFSRTKLLCKTDLHIWVNLKNVLCSKCYTDICKISLQMYIGTKISSPKVIKSQTIIAIVRPDVISLQALYCGFWNVAEYSLIAEYFKGLTLITMSSSIRPPTSYSFCQNQLQNQLQHYLFDTCLTLLS